MWARDELIMERRIVVDAVPIPAENEIAAICAGRKTFSLMSSHLVLRNKPLRDAGAKHLIYATHVLGEKCRTGVRPYRQEVSEDFDPPF